MSKTQRTEDEVQPTAPSDEFLTCPYLGLLDDPETHALFPRADHRCQLPGAAVTTPDSDWQERYCLSGRHDQCPIFRAQASDEAGSSSSAPDRRRWWQGSIVVMLLILVATTMVAIGLSARHHGSDLSMAENQMPASKTADNRTATSVHVATAKNPAALLTLTPPARASATAPNAVTPSLIAARPSPADVPTSASPTEPAATPSPEPPTPTTEAPAATPSVRTYTVADGDTLLDIAQRFSVSEQQLIDLNHLPDPNFIYAGEVLQLPPP